MFGSDKQVVSSLAINQSWLALCPLDQFVVVVLSLLSLKAVSFFLSVFWLDFALLKFGILGICIITGNPEYLHLLQCNSSSNNNVGMSTTDKARDISAQW
jgi:hypothetical protein